MNSDHVRRLTSPPDATVELPGSKSITNRCLLAAALATGQSQLSGFLRADDTEAMIDCVTAFGATVEVDSTGTNARVNGTHGRVGSSGTVHARQSGTTARFVAPVLATTSGPWTLDGDPQLRARPMGDLFSALRGLGATVSSSDGERLPALVEGPITGERATIRGDQTSQFLSGLLLCAPLLPKGLEIELVGELVSRPYVEMTVRTLRRFGITIESIGKTFRVAHGHFVPQELMIEPDASAASYLFAAAAITKGRIEVMGLGSRSIQGDMAFLGVLEKMGVSVTTSEDRTEVRGTGRLEGVKVDCKDFSDVVPTIAVVAAFATSPTQITGIGFIRHKESDRISAVVSALRALGVDAVEEDDGMSISPGTIRHGAVVTHGDHRIAMAFALAGLVIDGVVIDDPSCVAKTFPDYFDTLNALAR